MSIHFLCHLCLEYKEIYHPSGVVDEREEILRFAKCNCVDPVADVAVDSIARFFSSYHGAVAQIASLGARDASLAGISLFGVHFWIDCHAADEFFDFLEVSQPQMSKTMMPSVVWKGLWWLTRLVWLASNRGQWRIVGSGM